MHRKGRVQWQRETWLKEKDDRIDVRFFYGRGTKDPQDDEVVLDVVDDYVNFALKVKAMQAWSLERGYEWVLKTDDDCFGVLDRILMTAPLEGDYVGRRRGPSGGKQHPYASGFAYWTSTRARQLAVSHKWDFDAAEDRYIGNLLADAGIPCRHEGRFVVHQSKRSAISKREGPRVDNDVALSCEYEVREHMLSVAAQWEAKVPSGIRQHSLPDGSLRDVDVLVKTFLRDGYLDKALDGLETNYKSARIVVVDDGHHDKKKAQRYYDMVNLGHSVEVTSFDSGFGHKSNVGSRQARRKYMLIGSDDFNFDLASRAGVEKMIDVMESRPDIGFCGGRVNQQPYDGYVSERDGVLTETPTNPLTLKVTKRGTAYAEVDLTVNWGLVRTDLFKKGLHWCPEWKIGGDHFMFFDALKKLGYGIALCPTASVSTLPQNIPQWQDTDYPKMRGRAWDALPGFFKRRGITRYNLFDKSFDELRGDTLVHALPDGRVTRTVPVTAENSSVCCSVCGYKEAL